MFIIGFANTISFTDVAIPVIKLLAGLGAFLIGVKIMSDCMTQLANVGLKKLFVKLENNKLLGVGMGAITSAVIHSSAVTTVMVIGFVNAGIMTLNQATAVIMGANIGTTITALTAALSSFDIMTYVLVFTLVGYLAMTISKNEKAKDIGYMLAGLGLIFLSLAFMKSAVVPFTDRSTPVGEMVSNFLSGITNPFVLLLLGIALTFAFQSSTALTTLLIAMVAPATGEALVIGGAVEGGISNGVLFMILGSNIGTCFTSLMATANTNTNAKRAALIHLLFNVFGSAIFFVLLFFWKDFSAVTLVSWMPNNPSMQIAVFHTIFNTLCTALFLPFSNVFVKVVCKLMPDKAEDKTRQVMYIDDRFLATPSIAVQQSKKEARHIGDLVMETCDVAINAFMSADVSAEKVITDNLNEVGNLNRKLVQYMVTISANATTTVHSEGTLSSLYYVLGDLMRVGDLSTNIAKYTQKIADGEVTFSEQVYPEIQNMYDKVRNLYDQAMDCFINKDYAKLKEIEKLEDEIDQIRKELVNRHIERLNAGECDPASNGVFINLVGNIERMGDHLTFIAESITKHPDDFRA